MQHLLEIELNFVFIALLSGKTRLDFHLGQVKTAIRKKSLPDNF
jgi:hypothetical protein